MESAMLSSGALKRPCHPSPPKGDVNGAETPRIRARPRGKCTRLQQPLPVLRASAREDEGAGLSNASSSSKDEQTGLSRPESDILPAMLPELFDNQEAEKSLLQLGTRWRAMTEHSRAALPPEAAQLQEQQISQFTASMRQARMRSAVELLGRKQLAPGDELPLTPADPAGRILEALLNEPDQAQRMQMLPEAMQAPETPVPVAEEGPDEELLWTTPIKLLQAIDLALSRMEKLPGAPHPDKRLLSGASASQHRDLPQEVQALREEIFRIWEDSSP